MTLMQGLVWLGLGILAVKAIASGLGKDIALLNLAVTGILLAFVGFELLVLGRALVERLG
ncbi:MAG: hypothetical protein AAFY15_05060 [Cyanobacteria bacterium J06648_11]